MLKDQGAQVLNLPGILEVVEYFPSTSSFSKRNFIIKFICKQVVFYYKFLQLAFGQVMLQRLYGPGGTSGTLCLFAPLNKRYFITYISINARLILHTSERSDIGVYTA